MIIVRTLMLCVTVIILLAAYSVYSNMKWQEYAEQHECTVVSKTNGYHIMQPSYNIANGTWSTAPIYYPGHTVYKCKNGTEYSR